MKYLALHDKEPRNLPGTKLATEALKDVYEVYKFDEKQLKDERRMNEKVRADRSPVVNIR